MPNIIWVMIGGAIGASFRYIVIRNVSLLIKHVFPWPTITVNLTGSFLIGILSAWFLQHELWLEANQPWKLFLLTGVLGSYTTFSTFSNEVHLLIRERFYKSALANVLIQNIAGLLLVAVGYFITSALL